MLKIAAAVGLAGLTILAVAIVALRESLLQEFADDAYMDPDGPPTYIHPRHGRVATHTSTAGVESATRRERNAAGFVPRLAQTSQPARAWSPGVRAGWGT